MGMMENMARTMRIYMEQKNKSAAAFSEELEIARSTLLQYIEGKGNPSLHTVEHIARKLEIDPLTLVSGKQSQKDISAAAYVLQASMLATELSPEDRRSLFDSFEKVVSLLEKAI